MKNIKGAHLMKLKSVFEFPSLEESLGLWEHLTGCISDDRYLNTNSISLVYDGVETPLQDTVIQFRSVKEHFKEHNET